MIQYSKKDLLPFKYGVFFSYDLCLKMIEEKDHIKAVPYALVVRSLTYVMLCIRPYICFIVKIVSRYQSNLGMKQWMAIKHIRTQISLENEGLYVCIIAMTYYPLGIRIQTSNQIKTLASLLLSLYSL